MQTEPQPAGSVDFTTPPNEAERDYLRIDHFPKAGSQCREFIFSRTGFSAKPMDMRGWLLFNRSLNHGFAMGLDEKTVQVLSMLDHSLSQVKRFSGMPHMHEIVADSTAAHSKQVMHIVQDIVSRTFPGRVPPAIEQLRKEALLGAWVHDMGEIVVELTTASDIFNMSAQEQKTVNTAKNNFERELFRYACDLAVYYLDTGIPEQFPAAIDDLRTIAAGKSGVLEKIYALRARMQATHEAISFKASPIGDSLLAIYDSTEEPLTNNFLHPFVKTLECVEGQRYLQRNSAISTYTRMEFAPSHEIVEGMRRSERRLPMLFSQVDSIAAADRPAFEKLARQTASFTYGSLARQFTPRPEDYVSLSPAFIDRAPDAREEPRTSYIVPEYRAIVRGNRQNLLAERYDRQGDTLDKRIITRGEAGALYRAAQEAVLKDFPRFRPAAASLIALNDTPAIPEALQQTLRKQEYSVSGPSAGRAA